MLVKMLGLKQYIHYSGDSVNKHDFTNTILIIILRGKYSSPQITIKLSL